MVLQDYVLQGKNQQHRESAGNFIVSERGNPVQTEVVVLIPLGTVFLNFMKFNFQKSMTIKIWNFSWPYFETGRSEMFKEIFFQKSFCFWFFFLIEMKKASVGDLSMYTNFRSNLITAEPLPVKFFLFKQSSAICI